MLAVMQQANRKTITGIVLDPQGESIIGANVMEKEPATELLPI